MAVDERVLMFRVLGTPRPKPSVRGVRGVFTVRVKREANIWREAIVREARSAADTMARAGHRLEWLWEPVVVESEFRFTPPDRAMRRMGQPHGVKPDADNLLKLLYDAMQDAGVLRGGDQRVSAPVPRKVWAATAGVWVVMRPDVYQAHTAEALRGPALHGGLSAE